MVSFLDIEKKMSDKCVFVINTVSQHLYWTLYAVIKIANLSE